MSSGVQDLDPNFTSLFTRPRPRRTPIPIPDPHHGFVRPRYVDGQLDETLPLADRFLEWLAGGSSRLTVVGPRGSGLTTALRWLAQLMASQAPAGGQPLFRAESPAERAALRDGRAVLFVDASVQPAGGCPRSALEHAARVVWVGDPVDAACARTDEVRLRLAPWGRDELLELLGSVPRYRGDRAWLLGTLQARPTLRRLLRWPWAARRVLDALLRERPDPARAQAFSSRLQAALLDGLRPASLNLLRALPPRPCDVEGVSRALAQVPALRVDDLPELGRLLNLNPQVCRAFGAPESPRWREVGPDAFGSQPVALAFPGLQHFLRAGDCLRAVAQGEAPPPLARPWLPHLAALASAEALETARGWLASPTYVAARADAFAASLLWASGERPAFPPSRAFEGADALLDGLDAPGAVLGEALLRRASLRDARLVDAQLSEADLREANLARACLRGARLRAADLSNARLDQADLEGACLDRANLLGASLRGARLCGADVLGAELRATDLRQADLAGVDLAGSGLIGCRLDGADFAGADLSLTRLIGLDLRPLAGLPTTLAYAALQRCQLDGLTLDDVRLHGISLAGCALSGVSLRGAHLQGTTFRRCRMHQAQLDGADLRGALFKGVKFQAGSCREGMLSGKPALEGNMTGYYLEGVSDEAWAPPESIAQASLRGADLRGAQFRETSLFRVDLRGAQLDPDLAARARRDGAILDER